MTFVRWSRRRASCHPTGMLKTAPGSAFPSASRRRPVDRALRVGSPACSAPPMAAWSRPPELAEEAGDGRPARAARDVRHVEDALLAGYFDVKPVVFHALVRHAAQELDAALAQA